MPATVQAVLAARIDRLPPEDKRLLQTAAVIGKDVPFALLQAIAELPEDELRRGLARLQAAEFLYETSLFPELEYTFKHALTHEVAYGSLLQERRRGLHARIVEAIERLYADRLAEQVERLAHHALRGEVWDKAVAYCRQAGDQGAGALGLSRGRGAASSRRSRRSPASPRDAEHIAEQAIDLRLDLRARPDAVGESRASRSTASREAEALARALGDERRLGCVCVPANPSGRPMGELEERRGRAASAALAIAPPAAMSASGRSRSRLLGEVYWAQGDYASGGRVTSSRADAFVDGERS